MFKTAIAGNHWLEARAASEYRAMLRDGCPPGITEAGRTYAYQAQLYWRWKVGLLNAPSVARPGSSLHEKGIALDLPEPARSWVRTHGAKYGWRADRVPGEPWHFEFTAPPTLAPKPSPKSTPEPIEQSEDDPMYAIVSFKDSKEIGLYNPRTDAYVKIASMPDLERARTGLAAKEVTFLTRAGFDNWRALYSPTLKG